MEVGGMAVARVAAAVWAAVMAMGAKAAGLVAVMVVTAKKVGDSADERAAKLEGKGVMQAARVQRAAAVVCWRGGCVRTCTVGRACRSIAARDHRSRVLPPHTRHIGIHCTCTRWLQSTPV